MRVDNVHERRVEAPCERVRELFADLDALWPVHRFPAPVAEGAELRLGTMLWRPVERDDAVAAFEIVEPADFRAAHWFEVECGEEDAVVRHTVRGEAAGAFARVWREQVRPLHDAYIESMFDRLEGALA